MQRQESGFFLLFLSTHDLWEWLIKVNFGSPSSSSTGIGILHTFCSWIIPTPRDEFLPPIPSGLKVHLAALTSKSEDTHLETAASASRSRSRGVQSSPNHSFRLQLWGRESPFENPSSTVALAKLLENSSLDQAKSPNSHSPSVLTIPSRSCLHELHKVPWNPWWCAPILHLYKCISWGVSLTLFVF